MKARASARLAVIVTAKTQISSFVGKAFVLRDAERRRWDFRVGFPAAAHDTSDKKRFVVNTLVWTKCCWKRGS
jgi:hypothetical protein